ncbi:MAG: TMEM254 family protein [Mycobacteriaceae bacterium]
MSSKTDKPVRPASIGLAIPLYALWAAISFSGKVQEQIGDDTQALIRRSFVLTIFTHIGEAALMVWRLRRRGFSQEVPLWTVSTLLWGVINHVRVGKLGKSN